MTLTQTPNAAPEFAVDPVQARAEFFFNLELLELTATIPQAAPAAAVSKY